MDNGQGHVDQMTVRANRVQKLAHASRDKIFAAGAKHAATFAGGAAVGIGTGKPIIGGVAAIVGEIAGGVGEGKAKKFLRSYRKEEKAEGHVAQLKAERAAAAEKSLEGKGK